jgi:uncharacterized membrane protein
MKVITKTFWKGLILVIPVTLTIYLLIWLSSKAEGLFGNLIEYLLGDSVYFPGFGILALFIVIMIVGVLANNYFTSKLINKIAQQFEKVPLIKTIYNPLRDLMGLFGKSSNSNQSMKKVVLVKSEMGFEMLGLVTRDEFQELKANSELNGRIAVYIPCSYMLGGFTVLAYKENVKEIDMPVEVAIKLAITGWVKANSSQIQG